MPVPVLLPDASQIQELRYNHIIRCYSIREYIQTVLDSSRIRSLNRNPFYRKFIHDVNCAKIRYYSKPNYLFIIICRYTFLFTSKVPLLRIKRSSKKSLVNSYRKTIMCLLIFKLNLNFLILKNNRKRYPTRGMN